jgi:SAM-dependent methyltransferase
VGSGLAQAPSPKVGANAAFQHDSNARIYRLGRTARHYQGDILLTRAETLLLLKHQPAFVDKDVLDIGVGTGRTTIYLAPLARRYQAVDYSPAMVTRFKQNFTDVPIALADMTDLGAFADASFDFVLATNNVFCAVGHEARLRTLQEIRRLLRPSGMLVFSSHNRNDVHGLGRYFRPEFDRNPLKQLVLAARWCVASFNHARLAHRQLFTDEYAIVNDEAHGGTMLHYYISPDRQRSQLAASGFELLEMYDRWGKLLTPGDSAARSQWVFYVAKRIQVS